MKIESYDSRAFQLDWTDLRSLAAKGVIALAAFVSAWLITLGEPDVGIYAPLVTAVGLILGDVALRARAGWPLSLEDKRAAWRNATYSLSAMALVYLPGVQQYVSHLDLGVASAAVAVSLKLAGDALLKLVRDNRPDLPLPPGPPTPPAVMACFAFPLLLLADMNWERVADWGPQWFLVFSMLYVAWFHVANPIVKAHREYLAAEVATSKTMAIEMAAQSKSLAVIPGLLEEIRDNTKPTPEVQRALEELAKKQAEHQAACKESHQGFRPAHA